jgi:hypothetical protein
VVIESIEQGESSDEDKVKERANRHQFEIQSVSAERTIKPLVKND